MSEGDEEPSGIFL